MYDCNSPAATYAELEYALNSTKPPSLGPDTFPYNIPSTVKTLIQNMVGRYLDGSYHYTNRQSDKDPTDLTGYHPISLTYC